MEDIRNNKNWHLIRNNNGEWISDEHAVFLDKPVAFVYEFRAAKCGLKLSRQTLPDGTSWYYRHEIEQIEATMAKEVKTTGSRMLKIRKVHADEANRPSDIYLNREEERKEAYYDREMTQPLVSFLKNEYRWLIDYVYQHEELDFQTGKNAYSAWFSIYRGTGRVLTLKTDGTITADPKYKELLPGFYESPATEEFDVLLKKIGATESLAKYYIGADGKKMEGYYQNLISRRYSLFCRPDDDWMIIDKEFTLGYQDKNTKAKWLAAPQEWLASKINLAKQNGIPGNIKEPGTECDFMGITKDGDLVLMELKRHEDTSKIYLSPLQVGHYDELTRNFLEQYREDMSHSIIRMMRQKIALRLLRPAWQTLPDKLSGKIKLAVVVGGEASEVAKRRFTTMRKVVGKDIVYYTCDESTGTLIQETW